MTEAPIGPVIKRGSLRMWYVFDIGNEVHLEAAAQCFVDRPGQTRPQFQPRLRQPEFFGFRPRPFRLQKTTGEFKVGKYPTNRMADLTLWPGGRMSVEYVFELPEGTTLHDVSDICARLSAEQILGMDARQQATTLVEGELRGAIEEPKVKAQCEDYAVLVVEEFDTEIEPEDLIEKHGLLLTQFLRQEDKKVRLSPQVIKDALKHRFSWAQDLTVIDWNAAILYGDGMDDILNYLEFNQVQLLGLRYLNSSLDAQLDVAYALFEEAQREIHRQENSKFKWGRRISSLLMATAKQIGFFTGEIEPVEQALTKIGMLAVEARKASGAIRDAINVIGDPTLYRIHRLAAKRFGFKNLTGNIEDQLRELDGIYAKIHDQKKENRGIFLEIVVIILITIEVFQSMRH